ncbi:MAG: hypothetical protein ACLFO2_03025 [Candidatus Woesearchaeota archaeon]
MTDKQPEKSAKKAAKKAAPKKSAKKTSTKKASVEPEGKKESTKAVWYLVGALVVIAAILVIGAWSSMDPASEDCDEEYNNFCFIEQDDMWSVRVMVNGQPYRVAVHHLPEELEDIPIDPKAVETVQALSTMVNQTGDGRLFITMNPEAPSGVVIAGVEIAKITGERYDIYNIPTRVGLTKRPESVSEDTPIVDCSSSGEDTFVIYLREHDRNYVGVPEQYPQCLVIQGTDADEVVKSADRFLYALFGVM